MDYIGSEGSPYAGYITAASLKYGVSSSLLEGLFAHESNFNPVAVSPTGDYGLGQINLASHPSVTKAEAFNPKFNIFWSAKYLANLIKQYGIVGGLEAYNTGNPSGITSNTPGGSRSYANAVLADASKYGYGGGGGTVISSDPSSYGTTWANMLTSMNSMENQPFRWFAPGADVKSLIFKSVLYIIALWMVFAGLLAMLGIGVSDAAQFVKLI